MTVNSSKSKLRISIAINTSWNIYNFRKGMILDFLKRGWEVHAIAPEDEYSKELISLGCIFHPIHMNKKGTNPLQDYKTYKEYLKVFQKVQPDISLHYTVKPNIYGTLAAKKLNIPVISNISGLGTLFIRKNFISKIGIQLYKRALKHPKTVFFQNNDDRKLFINNQIVSEKQTDLVPGSGVDTNLFTPYYEEKENLSFLMVARLIYDKGIVEYYEAAKIVKKEFPNVSFNVCGFIEPDAGLGINKEKIKEWENEGTINYLGSSDDIKTIINQHQVIVLPSYREGTPKTLLEAAATAKPIITTNAPGCKEVVKDGINGYLCKVKDSLDLSSQMKRMILLSREERKAMGNEGRKLIETSFAQEFVISKYTEKILKHTPEILHENH